MYERIAVALDHSKESSRAFSAGLELAARLNSTLFTVTVLEPLPGLSYLAALADPAAIFQVEQEHQRRYADLIAHAADQARTAHGLEITSVLLDGDRIDSITGFVANHYIDLLVVGLHRSALRTHSLWSTVYTLAQNLRLDCSMLGVH